MDLSMLVWLIPAVPLVAFFVILLFTRNSKRASDIVAVVAILISWVVATVVLLNAIGIGPDLGKHPIESSIVWLPFGESLDTAFRMGVLIDPLGAVMLFFVPLTATMIFIYSTGYMASGHYWTEIKGEAGHDDHHGEHGEALDAAHDDHGHEIAVDSAGRRVTKIDATVNKARFMAFLALFATGMLLLSVADNLLMLFVGWEVMGLCSFLLIGFWHDRIYPNQPNRITPIGASIKAFMTTRVGDMFMLAGIVWLYSVTGTLSFREILYNEHTLEMLAEPSSLFPALSVGGLIALLIFIGTVGKSAQFPLHTWLPDAMEGPTPVSAMIHAATMVSAGVYLIIRIFPLIAVDWQGHGFPVQMQIIAGVGAFTALFAATIAMAQRDVKKVLAYSTISQLGYMVAAVGIGAYVAAAFHLVTHAIFKALLFMGSGSVIHAVEHGEEHAHHHGHHFPIDFDAQDMFNMGGLWHKIPVTAWTFLIGGLALSGFPVLTAGFWSKDEILLDAYLHAPVVFVVLATAAFLTAFYTMRQIGLTFAGQPRTHAAEEATQKDWRMNLPLVILAVFAVVTGYVGVHPDFPVLGRLLSSPEGSPFKLFVGATLLEKPELPHFEWAPLLTSIGVALGGLLVGYLVYVRRPLAAGQEDPLKKLLGPLYTLFENKYYFDEAYDFLFVRPSQWLAARIYEVVDRGIIDGILHGVAFGTQWFAFRNKDFDTYVVNGAGDETARSVGRLGQAFRYVQSGRVQQYLTVAVLGILALAGVFVWSIFFS